MTLKDLALAPVRENSGPRAGAGFTFQKNWAICWLLDRHEQGDDYVMAFDYQDDVVVIDDPANTAQFHFFQVKAKNDGSWTLPSLLKRKKKASGNAELSILAKLYDDKLRWPDNTVSLNFVTNASFKVTLADKSAGASTSRDDIQFAELADDQRQQARASVKSEHALAHEPQFEKYTFLRVAKLSVKDSSGHAVGKVEEFLERRAPNRKRLAKPFYQTLFSEVTRRNDHAAPVKTYDELLENKSLTREQVEGFVKLAATEVDLDAVWNSVSNRMDHEGVPLMRTRSIRQEWNRYEVQRLEVRNESLAIVRASIRNVVHRAIEESVAKITTILDLVDNDVEVRLSRSHLFSADYACAIALMELYEESELPPTDSEPAQKH